MGDSRGGRFNNLRRRLNHEDVRFRRMSHAILKNEGPRVPKPLPQVDEQVFYSGFFVNNSCWEHFGLHNVPRMVPKMAQRRDTQEVTGISQGATTAPRGSPNHS